jgi:hypothetical protein
VGTRAQQVTVADRKATSESATGTRRSAQDLYVLLGVSNLRCISRLTYRVKNPHRAIDCEDIMQEAQNINPLIYEKHMPCLKLVHGVVVCDNGKKTLGENDGDPRGDGDPRKHIDHSAGVALVIVSTHSRAL